MSDSTERVRLLRDLPRFNLAVGAEGYVLDRMPISHTLTVDFGGRTVVLSENNVELIPEVAEPIVDDAAEVGS